MFDTTEPGEILELAAGWLGPWWRGRLAIVAAALEQAGHTPDAVVWLLRERTGRPVAAYTNRATAIKRRVELAHRNPSTFDISFTEVVPVVVDPTVDELFDPAAMRKLRATQADTDATAETEASG